MKLAFRIAWRFLMSSRGQTALISVGIAVGIAVQVFIGSLITGLQKSLVDKTIGSSSQVTVLPQESGGLIDNYASVLSTIKAAAPSVTQATAVADASGFLRYGDKTSPVLVRGFDFASANGIYKFDKALKDGSLPAGDQIALGTDLLKEIGLKVGDTVDILTPKGTTRSVKISGSFDLQVTSLNKSWALAPRSLVQDVFALDDKATAVEAQVSDVFKADEVAASIASALPSGLKTDNWKAQNASLLSGLNGQSVSSLMIQVFVLVSVVLGIASVLAISVLQKSRQIGILKAMGIRDRTASAIFLAQGLMLGVFGAVLGVGFGVGLGAMFTTFALGPDGLPVVPLYLDPVFILISGLIGVLAAAVASLIPARRSSRLDPMEVIRNG